MQEFLTDDQMDSPNENAIVPATVTMESGYNDNSQNTDNKKQQDVIDLDEDEVVVHDLNSVGGSWESSHKTEGNRPAPKGRSDYKTQKQRLAELEAAYQKAKDALDEEWAAYEKKMKALKKKRKKALRKNDKLIAVEYRQEDFAGDYPDIVEEKLMNVGFTEISFEPIKDVLAHNMDKLDIVESVVVNSILYFKPQDLFPYDCPIVIHYHEKTRLELPFSPSELKKLTVDEAETALKEAGFCNITRKMVPITGFKLLKKPGKIESFTISDFGLTVEHQTAEFDEPIVISYYTKD